MGVGNMCLAFQYIYILIFVLTGKKSGQSGIISCFAMNAYTGLYAAGSYSKSSKLKCFRSLGCMSSICKLTYLLKSHKQSRPLSHAYHTRCT